MTVGPGSDGDVPDGSGGDGLADGSGGLGADGESGGSGGDDGGRTVLAALRLVLDDADTAADFLASLLGPVGPDVARRAGRTGWMARFASQERLGGAAIPLRDQLRRSAVAVDSFERSVTGFLERFWPATAALADEPAVQAAAGAAGRLLTARDAPRQARDVVGTCRSEVQGAAAALDRFRVRLLIGR